MSHNEKLASAAWTWMTKALKGLDAIAKLADKESKAATSLAAKLEAQSYRKAARAGHHAVAMVFSKKEEGAARDKDPWAPSKTVKKRMNASQKKALVAYRFAVQQEDRYLGSVFVNHAGQKRVEAMTKAAYEECKRLGLGIEHGL